MTKRSLAKYKICKQLDQNIWGRDINHKIKSSMSKKTTISEYTMKLKEKQKLKKFYANLTERQFYNYYRRALQLKGKTYSNLLTLLERRLDTIIYRMNFSNTMFKARQMINHGFFTINNKKVNISSYQVQNGDLIKVSNKYLKLLKKDLLTNLENGFIINNLPGYLEVNYKLLTGVFLEEPKTSEIPYPMKIEPKLIIEFYNNK